MTAMANSKVTIHINGQGDGFITPTRGLRQGCPLSPYLFILSMEFLTKHIQMAVQSRNLKGLKLAATAPILTSLIYADDLMLMGMTTQTEIGEFKRIMRDFAKVSGLAVNPSKSKVWFSTACGEESRQWVLGEFGAQQAEDSDKYLGIITSQNDHRLNLTHDLLFEKIASRLAGWKIGLLSHAGRLALIKAVLQSIPVYYMAVMLLPTKTTNDLKALMRKFFWGKIDRQRFMSFIAWAKICQPFDQGGLGIRDIKLFNEALVLKAVWQVASNSDRL